MIRDLSHRTAERGWRLTLEVLHAQLDPDSDYDVCPCIRPHMTLPGHPPDHDASRALQQVSLTGDRVDP